MTALGDFIRTAREAKKLTGRAFAKELGVNHQTIIWWETGVNIPNSTNIKAIARVLEVEREQLDALLPGATPYVPGSYSMTRLDCENLLNDLGLETDNLGLPAREATINYIQAFTANENNEAEGHIPCLASTFYDGYRQALEDNVIRIHDFLNIDITRQQGLPNPHRLLTK